MANWKNIPNNQGMIGIYADDSWFPSITSWQDGRNLTYPYFIIIITTGVLITGGEQHQATILASLSRQPSFSSTGTPNSNLQPGSRSDTCPSPPWLLGPSHLPGCSLSCLHQCAQATPSPDLAGRRTGREVREWRERSKPQPDDPEHGGSRADWAPPAGGGGGGGHHHQHILARDLHLPTSSLSATHGPTTTFALPVEHQHHQHHGAGSEAALATPDGPITLVDATMVADAFRKALRKPEVALPEAVPRPSSTSPPEQERIKSPLASSADPLHQHADQLPVPLHVRESMYAQVLSLNDTAPLDDDDDDGEEAKEIMDRKLASEHRSMTSRASSYSSCLPSKQLQ
ncbi:hypothetical protein PCANC_02782 [Puccinia coronata f. sp. avenae]|uniref:Uncharacterized protein n=1 Tax=Puccinia coronata f. sp. avenae TaxID=200324 RepID=A0A2N5W450_9BASI|nr:hypothetical protein PCANC_02782 [Puccinia coronata f. sp. avenae]